MIQLAAIVVSFITTGGNAASKRSRQLDGD